MRFAEKLYHPMFVDPEVDEVAARARAFAEEYLSPRAHRIATGDEVTDGFPADVFAAMGEAGLYRVPFGTEVGGLGLSAPASATVRVIEELAYSSSSVAATYDVHCILAGHALEAGSAEQRQRWLVPLIRGEIVGAFATSEPQASSDLRPASLQTVADERRGGWVVRGAKRWITNAPVAGVLVFLARTGQTATMFVVDPVVTEGVSIGRADRKMGNRGQITADVVFEDVKLSPDAVLGAVGGGLKVALSTLVYGRMGIAASGVGLAQAAFDRTATWLTERQTFGEILAKRQHWQFLMAKRAIEIEGARALYQKAALRLDSGVSFPEPEAAMAKVAGTTVAVDMARDAVQAFGARGFISELGADETPGLIETMYRDSKIAEIYEGTNEIQHWLIAREIFGRDITG